MATTLTGKSLFLPLQLRVAPGFLGLRQRRSSLCLSLCVVTFQSVSFPLLSASDSPQPFSDVRTLVIGFS